MCQQPKELDFNLQMQEASILSHTQTADTQTHNTIFLLQAMLAPRYAKKPHGSGKTLLKVGELQGSKVVLKNSEEGLAQC